MLNKYCQKGANIIPQHMLKQIWRRISHNTQYLLQLKTHAMTSILSPEIAKSKDSSYLKSIAADWERAKPFRQLPGPTRYQMIRGFMKGGELENISFIGLLSKLRQKYGDIYLMPGIGKASMLSVFDPIDFERIYRTEGKYPQRPGTEPNTFYREQRRDDFYKENVGLSGSGKEWADFRTKVNPVLMKTQNARLYLEPMLKVNEEFIQHIREIRDPITQEVPDNFYNDITHLTFETVAAVALDKQLGLIRSRTLQGDTQKLFDALHIFVESFYELGIKPGFYKYFRTPTYRRFEKAMDTIFDITKKYVDEALERIERLGGIDENRSVLEQLLKIDRKVAMIMAMDMMKAGVETTSSILSGAMLLLATHPEKQSKLRAEVLNALSQNKHGQFTYENVQHLPYLRAFIKESMRIHPLTAGNLRTVGMDITLGGYRIPKGTRVILNSNLLLKEERYFPRAEEFIPERWLRDGGFEHLIAENISPFVYMPFGFGPRTCVGKRIVNLEIEMVLANLVSNFTMEYNYSTDNAFECKFINHPVIPLKFKFRDL